MRVSGSPTVPPALFLPALHLEDASFKKVSFADSPGVRKGARSL